MTEQVKRPCAVCGKSQARRKVWEKFGNNVICYACAVEWSFWPNGSLYNRAMGPSIEQRDWLAQNRKAA